MVNVLPSAISTKRATKPISRAFPRRDMASPQKWRENVRSFSHSTCARGRGFSHEDSDDLDTKRTRRVQRGPARHFADDIGTKDQLRERFMASKCHIPARTAVLRVFAV